MNDFVLKSIPSRSKFSFYWNLTKHTYLQKTGIFTETKLRDITERIRKFDHKNLPRRHTALKNADLLYWLFYFVSSSVSDPGSGSEIQYHFAVSRSGSELFFPTEPA